MIDLNQLLRTPSIDPLFDISPDGNKLAFAWNKTGEWQIYELELGNPSNMKSITGGIGGKFNPRYSPDGSQLAYALDMDGSESYHLVAYDPATNKHIDLTPNIPFALQPNFCWSPDGSQLAFLSDEQGHFSTYTFRPMAANHNSYLIPVTLPGRWRGHPMGCIWLSPARCMGRIMGYSLLIWEQCHSERSEESLTPSERPFAIAQGDKWNSLNAHEPQWSPDGKKLAFHSDAHGWFDIGIFVLETKEIEWITKSEGDSQMPEFMGLNIVYTQSKGAFNWIEFVGQAFSLTTPDASEVGGLQTHPTKTNGIKKFQIGQGIHNGIRITSDMKRLVTTFSSPSQPPDLWMIDVESGESVQLTNSLPDALSKAEFIMPEEIQYEGMDGTQVPALLFRTKKTPAPAAVMIHGGPNWHYSAEWNPLMAYFASRGYVVMCPNYRGSTGYGRDWQYASQFDMGGVDTRDVAAGAEYLLREGLANKIAVTGRSHGGYLTMTCLTQFPELWCAGSAVVPFTNWLKSHDDSREDLQHWNIENMGDPKENYERWYNASPYFFLDRIQAPVQMICGGNDPRCPASDSIDTRDKLLEIGKEVDFLLYEDEGHSFLKIENIIESQTKLVEFITKALKE